MAWGWVLLFRFDQLSDPALHIKHLKPLARGASKKRTSLAPNKPTGPKALGQRNTTSTESQDAIVRLYDTFIVFSVTGGHIALRQHITLLLVRYQSADCPRGTHAVWPGCRARSPDRGLLKTVIRFGFRLIWNLLSWNRKLPIEVKIIFKTPAYHLKHTNN